MSRVTAVAYAADVMIDLETVGTKPGCGILTIGACTLEGAQKFYIAVDINSCYEAGLVADADTLHWWDKQSQQAYIAAFNNPDALYLTAALTKLSQWIKLISPAGVWGNGAAFDVPILEAAYDAVGLIVPWKYNASRCYRTLKVLYPNITAGEFIGEKHNALADAVYQARHAYKILNHITGAR